MREKVHSLDEQTVCLGVPAALANSRGHPRRLLSRISRLRRAMQRPRTEQDRVRLLAQLRASFFLPPLIEHKYAIQHVIGEGSYGVVCSAVDRETQQQVAVKRIISVFEETPEATRTLRELKFLRLLSSHENIITIKDVLLPSERDRFNDVFVVLELMPTDLSRVLRSNIELSGEHVRWLIYQLLRGIAYLHSSSVLHRDLKPSNILINAVCDLRIIDFGLARLPQSTQPDAPLLTDYVATRWYRAPELIVHGASRYSTAIDMWSVGCIFGEMLNAGAPLFPGLNNTNQIERILAVSPSPPPAMLSAMRASPAYAPIAASLASRPPLAGNALTSLLPRADKEAVDLLGRILCLDPARRTSAADAMTHPYFAALHDAASVVPGPPIPPEEFAFESQSLSREQLRGLFLDEILRYHPEKRESYLAARDERAYATAGQAAHFRSQFSAVADGMPAPRPYDSMPDHALTGMIDSVARITTTTSTARTGASGETAETPETMAMSRQASSGACNAPERTASVSTDPAVSGSTQEQDENHQMVYAGMRSVESATSGMAMNIASGNLDDIMDTEGGE